jgi:hypothetical protein
MDSMGPITAVQKQQHQGQQEQQEQQKQADKPRYKTLLQTERMRVLQYPDASCMLVYRHRTNWYK